MALVVISGQPSSGKSTATALLTAEFEQLGASVMVLTEGSFGLTRDSAYSTPLQEKSTRGKLKSAVERVLSTKHVTIIDSLNNIKGFRYELWCFARGLGIRYCMVHVDTASDICRAWNASREGDKYSPAVLEDLLCRFERPDARNRWDSPLFTLQPSISSAPSDLHEQLEPSTADNPAEFAGSPGRSVPAAPADPTVSAVDTALSTALLGTSLADDRPSFDSMSSAVYGIAAPDSTAAASSSNPPADIGHAPSGPPDSAAAVSQSSTAASASSAESAAVSQSSTAASLPASGAEMAALAAIHTAATPTAGQQAEAAPNQPDTHAATSTASPTNTSVQAATGCTGAGHLTKGVPHTTPAPAASTCNACHTPATTAMAAPSAPNTSEVKLGAELTEGITIIARAMMGLGSTSTGHVTAQLTPTPATTNPKLLGTNLLHELDQATQEVIQAITNAQVTSGGQPLGLFTLQPNLPQLELHQVVSPAELRRHKRSFMKLSTKVTFARLQDSLAAKRMFVEYLCQGLAR